MDSKDLSGVLLSSYKKYTIVKIIQLSVEAIIGIAYFLMVLTNKSVSSVIFTNRPVFFLSFFMWMLLMVCFVGCFYDFYTLQININNSRLLSKVAYLDSTTGIPNRNSCDDFIRLFKTPDSIQSAGCAVFSISNLASINKSFGHDAGNEALKDLSALLEEAVEPFGFVGRNGSNDFLAIIGNCSKDKMNEMLNSFESLLEQYNKETNQFSLCIKQAYILNEELKATDIYDMIRVSYQKMFEQ